MNDQEKIALKAVSAQFFAAMLENNEILGEATGLAEKEGKTQDQILARWSVDAACELEDAVDDEIEMREKIEKWRLT